MPVSCEVIKERTVTREWSHTVVQKLMLKNCWEKGCTAKRWHRGWSRVQQCEDPRTTAQEVWLCRAGIRAAGWLLHSGPHCRTHLSQGSPAWRGRGEVSAKERD